MQGVKQPTVALKWLSDKPVWVEQWPLSIEKLTALHTLVQEQLDAGHIEPSHSPWNTPVFVIKKKSGKWRLLQDLRRINEVIATMGALQPGLPSATMIPMNWPIIIIDLKDCFFTIPFRADDKEKFAFTVPSVNYAEPSKRYHWKFLPQGMKNSPTICQWFVAQALSPVREKYPEGYCYHYMDGILLAAPSSEMLSAMESDTHTSLKQYGLVVAPEKVQCAQPWFYFGMKVLEHTVQPQALQLNTKVKNLNDLQKLAGTINWLRPYFGLTTSQIQPLIDLLKGSSDLYAPRSLTPQAKQAIALVEQQMQTECVENCH
ncbi:endogenous retrovirus group K member 18 Pol protein-like protein [Pitangus sulphuratus]|nr:endogenous retrovirus group K member 18 Pol protein-like protein [Pitangus sulphuratus]